MGWEDDVGLRALPVNLVHAPPAAGAHGTPDAALIHDLQCLGEVRVEQEVQGTELLVGGGARFGDGVQDVGPQRLNGSSLHFECDQSREAKCEGFEQRPAWQLTQRRHLLAPVSACAAVRQGSHPVEQ